MIIKMTIEERDLNKAIIHHCKYKILTHECCPVAQAASRQIFGCSRASGGRLIGVAYQTMSDYNAEQAEIEKAFDMGKYEDLRQELPITLNVKVYA